MKKSLIKQLLNEIKEKKVSLSQLEELSLNYLEYGFTKSQVRKCISMFENTLLKDIGILDRNMPEALKQKIKLDLNLKSIIISNNENVENNNEKEKKIDQKLKVGDIIYTFRLQDKLYDITI